ncbi:MAG: plastocyanin/azurin family copper-binding protein [Pseudomonadota bacterium]
MKMNRRRFIVSGTQLSLAFGALGSFAGAPGLAGASSEVTSHKVLARGVKFDPVFVFIEPGDQIEWENMASHNVETIDEMVPEGQPKIKTKLGDNYFTTFDTVGIIVYKCTPHWGARMGGVITVGTPDDPGGILDRYLASTEVVKKNLPARGLIKKVRKEMEERGMVTA